MTTAIQAGHKLDLKADLRWIGPKDEHGYLWAQQDGVIFCWSNSNTQYESAWWLNTDGTPAIGKSMGQQQIIDKINTDRPFSLDWLNA